MNVATYFKNTVFTLIFVLSLLINFQAMANPLDNSNMILIYNSNTHSYQWIHVESEKDRQWIEETQCICLS